MDDKNNEVDQKVDDVMLPGFRFHPTDEELVGFYLKRKILQQSLPIELIKQVDIYKYDPWDLPKLASTGEKEWYFYCPRDRKYRNSTRPNRVTGAGFWKATGTDRPIYSSDGAKCIGLKKSLVFYRGRAAKGIKTDWMMHEFRLPSLSDSAPPKKLFDKNLPPNDSWAICRIFKKINSIAQRALSHSWISPIITPTETAAAASDIFNHQGPASNLAEFSPENMSCTTEAAGPSIQLCNINDHSQQYQQHHNSSTTAAFSPMNFVPPCYKPILAPASKSTNVFPTSNPTTDQAHSNFILSTLEMSGFPKSSPTVDFSSLFLNLSPAIATTDIAKATETIGCGRLQPSPLTLQEQFNWFPMFSSLHDMQGGSMTGSAGEEQVGFRRSHGTNSTQVGNHQWGSSIRSMGFPLNLPAEIWKPTTLLSSWESQTAAAAAAATCPSEISNTN